MRYCQRIIELVQKHFKFRSLIVGNLFIAVRYIQIFKKKKSSVPLCDSDFVFLLRTATGAIGQAFERANVSSATLAKR